MPRFTPFRAHRYASDRLDDLVAPPYDVLDEPELDALDARSPHSITRVDVPRERDGDHRYERAAATLRSWLADGVLVTDDAPTFTIYRLAFRDGGGREREIVGVLGGCEVGPYGECGVYAHERVTPKASTDRLDLTRATATNLSPIWGLSLAAGLTDLLREPGEPVATVEWAGVRHTVERVTDPERIAAIAAAVGSDDVLIADGHHRYGVAQRYRDERRAAGDVGSPAEETLMFVNELIADQLSVEPIHRVYRDVVTDELIAALDAGFERSPAPAPDATTPAEMERRGSLCLVHADGTAEWLSPRPGAFDGLRDLDGVWLEHLVAGVEHSVGYQHDVERVVDLVVGGDAHAGVLIRPVPLAEIERTARHGEVMPPKSTFFTPKLLTGLVLRPL